MVKIMDRESEKRNHNSERRGFMEKRSRWLWDGSAMEIRQPWEEKGQIRRSSFMFHG